MNDDITYLIPAGSKVKPSQVGYYNFWYPHTEYEYEAFHSFVGQPLYWTGSDEWDAVLVNIEEAKAYKSPIKVVWVKKEIIKDIKKKFYLKKGLVKKEEKRYER